MKTDVQKESSYGTIEMVKRYLEVTAMRCGKWLAAILMTALTLFLPSMCLADSYPSDSDTTDAWEEEEKPRFIEIHRDESFIYFMDRKTAYYTRIPHTIKEEMINVWIKLEPREYLEGDYTYPAKYYLEHYLIRPKRQQIQFLCEMEIAGRPSNDVEDRRYDPRRWESLVPGSIEDVIYHAVMLHKDDVYDESAANGTAVRDFIENTVNVSL